MALPMGPHQRANPDILLVLAASVRGGQLRGCCAKLPKTLVFSETSWSHSRAFPNVHFPCLIVLSSRCTCSEMISSRGPRGNQRLLEEKLRMGKCFVFAPCAGTLYGKPVVFGIVQMGGPG